MVGGKLVGGFGIFATGRRNTSRTAGIMAGIQHEHSAAGSLGRDLLSFSLYKPTQGRVARQVTGAALLLTFGIGVWRLWQLLPIWFSGPGYASSGLPMLMPALLLAALAVAAWLAFRVVNVPRFADFLISVESEMAKVSWPSVDEVVRSSMVIIFLIFALAAILAIYDLFWWFVLRAIQGQR